MEKKARRIPPIAISITIIVIAYCILSVIIGITTMPIRYDIRAGMVSPVTITATKDVVDTFTTNLYRENAAKQVEPSYVQDSSVAGAVMSALEAPFAAFVQLGVPDGEDAPEITQELVDEAAADLAPVTLTSARMELVLKTPQEDLAEIAAFTKSRVREHLNLNIAEGQESETIFGIQKELVSAGWDSILAGCAADVLRPYLQANMIVDAATTEANRDAARASVEDIVYIKGQNIVRAGEIVTAAQIEMLNSLGLLKEQGWDYSLISGVAILIAMLLGMLILYLATFEKLLLNSPGQVLLLMTILTISVLICWAVMQLNVYLMPTVLAVMLTCYLMKPRLALMTCNVVAVFVGLIASGASGIFTAAVFTTMINTLVSGALCIAVIRRSKGRTGVLLAGLFAGIANIITSTAIGLTNNSNIFSVLITACWAGGSGVLAGVLCIGIQPVLESAFNLTTTAKLFDLSNPNQPLLRRMLLEAPSTYHHSIMVANLAEAGANAIGANGLLARVGGYYHDVGKLKRPLYFRENQFGDNPHDRTDPRVSAAIILAHPGDGVQMAAKERLPEPILRIIGRHHAQSSVVFFLDKAIKQYGAENVDPADFRYTADLPQTKEEAIVMLADPVEAAARTLPSRDPQSIANLIDKLFDTRMQDGDLDDCNLTFADVAKIKEAFVTVMTGMYHERIEYPDPPPKHAGFSRTAQRLFNGKAKNAAANKPAVKPLEKSAEKPAEKPQEQIVDNSAPKAEKAPEMAENVDNSVENPVENPVESTVDNSVEKAGTPVEEEKE